jgi:DHA1 family bicyclomycin/chloramphenicol resistance-like MFS transporter
VVFIILAIVATVISLMVIKWLPESKAADPSYSLKPASILQGYRQVLRERQFTIYALSGAIASAGLFAYLAGSPLYSCNYSALVNNNTGSILPLLLPVSLVAAS